MYVAEDYDNREAALQTLWHSISSAPECSPQSFVQGLARNDASVLAHLPHNRTILLVGDSIDRNNIQYACYLLQGEHGIVLPDTPLWPQPEISITNPGPNSWQPNEYSARSFPTSCHIASIDLMIVNVFHFGLDEDTYFGWKDQYGPPYKTEDRIRQIALPLADKLQRSIDIVEFGAGVSGSDKTGCTFSDTRGYFADSCGIWLVLDASMTKLAQMQAYPCDICPWTASPGMQSVVHQCWNLLGNCSQLPDYTSESYTFLRKMTPKHLVNGGNPAERATCGTSPVGDSTN